MRPRLLSFPATGVADDAPFSGDATAFPEIAALIDPVALERRLAVARIRRAQALAARGAAAEAPRGARATPPPLVAERGEGAEPAASLAARTASTHRPRAWLGFLALTLCLAAFLWGEALGARLLGLLAAPGPAPTEVSAPAALVPPSGLTAPILAPAPSTPTLAGRAALPGLAAPASLPGTSAARPAPRRGLLAPAPPVRQRATRTARTTRPPIAAAKAPRREGASPFATLARLWRGLTVLPADRATASRDAPRPPAAKSRLSKPAKVKPSPAQSDAKGTPRAARPGKAAPAPSQPAPSQPAKTKPKANATKGMAGRASPPPGSGRRDGQAARGKSGSGPGKSHNGIGKNRGAGPGDHRGPGRGDRRTR